MKINKGLQYFLLGLSVSAIIIISFFVGAISDRVFVVKPVDMFLGKKPNLFTPQTPAPEGSAPTILNSQEKLIVDVAERTSGSVVTVAAKKQQSLRPLDDLFGFGFGQSPQSGGQTKQVQHDIGSGFVVEGGFVVTNRHVVDDVTAEFLVIDSQDKEHKILNIYRDPSNDLAVLRVEGLTAAPMDLGDSDSLKVGQSVIAIGTALGQFRHTVTTGVVSGLGRGIEAGDPFGGSTEALENVIQTDAAINPGNSGGPLLDSTGKVIGVNVAVSAAGQNIGFAIPINVIKTSLKQFNETGKFDRPFLGVRYQAISQQAALLNNVPQGVLVLEVVQGSSAAEAGIQTGDIITKFDGKELKDTELSKLINSKKIGDKVKVEYYRKTDKKEVELTLKGQS